MHIAVTGGNGDLGRALTPYLIEQGHQVVSIDRALPPEMHPDLRPMVVDLRSFGEFVAAICGCDALIHLAAHRSPMNHPDPVVYTENTTMSYNALSAAATLGIKRVVLASSINAIGGVFSRMPRYDYFPIDEQHPSYTEDPYSLSKWVLEQQADAFARRVPTMQIASLRFHWLSTTYQQVVQATPKIGIGGIHHLWAYTLLSAASRACLLGLTADFTGHEAFYIVGPRTVSATPSLELAAQHYPATPIRGDLRGWRSFFDCTKAERLLGWKHEEPDAHH
jgi:UDP-glucose 4-epimerase